MTLNEAAAIIGTTPDNLRGAIARGSLEAVKHGRDWWITPEEVERYARVNRRAGALRRLTAAEDAYATGSSAAKKAEYDAALADIERLARSLPDWMVEHPRGKTEWELRLEVAALIADLYAARRDYEVDGERPESESVPESVTPPWTGVDQ